MAASFKIGTHFMSGLMGGIMSGPFPAPSSSLVQAVVNGFDNLAVIARAS
jgi:hypothetical protein